MSNAHTNYKLDEAQAIMSELRTIKKAIYTGEKERRDLMQVRGRGALQSLHLSLCSPAYRSFIYLFPFLNMFIMPGLSNFPLCKHLKIYAYLYHIVII